VRAAAILVFSQLLTFAAPHVARAPHATLSTALAARVDALPKAHDADALVKVALDATAAQLHFGLAHRTSASFDVAEREGNCIEYAELFSTIFNREKGSLDARAYVVHSAEARVLGQRLDDPKYRDHDWALVVVAGGRRLFIDPTLYDEGFGWDISRAVTGPVTGLP
jgi:hypothetical protein